MDSPGTCEQPGGTCGQQEHLWTTRGTCGQPCGQLKLHLLDTGAVDNLAVEGVDNFTGSVSLWMTSNSPHQCSRSSAWLSSWPRVPRRFSFFGLTCPLFLTHHHLVM